GQYFTNNQWDEWKKPYLNPSKPEVSYRWNSVDVRVPADVMQERVETLALQMKDSITHWQSAKRKLGNLPHKVIDAVPEAVDHLMELAGHLMVEVYAKETPAHFAAQEAVEKAYEKMPTMMLNNGIAKLGYSHTLDAALDLVSTLQKKTYEARDALVLDHVILDSDLAR
ncbi:MAG: hypothetical protein KDD76_05595, partial [Rickettsiales bacterium]|nr:hypothetical protein [Rickettsiales bacterium]